MDVNLPDDPAAYIQGDSGGKVNNMEGDRIGDCETKNHMDMCLILNGYRSRAL
jgi:hypothetical protein